MDRDSSDNSAAAALLAALAPFSTGFVINPAVPEGAFVTADAVAGTPMEVYTVQAGILYWHEADDGLPGCVFNGLAFTASKTPRGLTVAGFLDKVVGAREVVQQGLARLVDTTNISTHCLRFGFAGSGIPTTNNNDSTVWIKVPGAVLTMVGWCVQNDTFLGEVTIVNGVTFVSHGAPVLCEAPKPIVKPSPGKLASLVARLKDVVGILKPKPEVKQMAENNKYGVIVAEKKQFHPGEPVFLLRPTDRYAASGVRAYAARCKAGGGCTQAYLDGLEAHASRIEKWQEEHPDLVKTPD